MAPAVQKDDRNGTQSGLPRALQIGSQRARIEGREDRARVVNALACLDHGRIQALGEHDVAREDIRPILIADAQRVAESDRRDEQHRLALALEQRVGRHRGADFDRLDRLARRAQDRARAADAGIRAAAAGLSRQQLADVQLAARREADDVRERASAVDPELPAGSSHALKHPL